MLIDTVVIVLIDDVTIVVIDDVVNDIVIVKMSTVGTATSTT